MTTFLVTKKYYIHKRNILFSSREDDFKNFHTKNNDDPLKRSRNYQKLTEK